VVPFGWSLHERDEAAGDVEAKDDQDSLTAGEGQLAALGSAMGTDLFLCVLGGVALSRRLGNLAGNSDNTLRVG